MKFFNIYVKIIKNPRKDLKMYSMTGYGRAEYSKDGIGLYNIYNVKGSNAK